MKVLFKKVGEFPKLIEIDHNLENMQDLVGGLIDCFDIENNISIIFDDEGKLKGKEPNIFIGKGQWKDVIVGDIFFCGVNKEKGEFISLTDEQIKYIMNIF